MGKSHDHELCTPDAEATIESIRSLGYDLGIAIADLIDNSLTAQAKNIHITYNWDGLDTYLAISDDGCGMKVDTLKKAMKLGSINPKKKREEKDLGRFGLGLKTASFSQARKLTVFTKQGNSGIAIRKWDLDHVAETGDWYLLKSTDGNSEKLGVRHLDKFKSGTVVLLQNLDRVVSLESDEFINRQFFLKKIENLKKYLGMIFHRYISGPKAISMYLYHDDIAEPGDSEKIKPWDPFSLNVKGHRILPPETLKYNGNTVEVSPFVLPHYSNYTTNESHVNAGGPYGWNSHQGFFIYRNRRLLMPGGWLGFYKQEDHYKLARIRVDIPNTMDEEWKIGVKKVAVTPPDMFKAELNRIAKLARQEAVKAYSFRGKISSRGNPKVNTFVWKVKKLRNGQIYRIDQNHPVIKQLIEKLNNKSIIKNLFRLIEGSVPVETIVHSERESPEAHMETRDSDRFDGIDIPALYKSFLELLVTKNGMTDDSAHEQIIQTEPFDSHVDLIQSIRGARKK